MVFDLALSSKWSKSESGTDYIMENQKGTWQRLLLHSCCKRGNAKHTHLDFLEVNDIVSTGVTEISIQPCLKQGIVPL